MVDRVLEIQWLEYLVKLIEGGDTHQAIASMNQVIKADKEFIKEFESEVANG